MVRKILAGVVGFAVAVGIAGGILEWVWSRYVPPEIVGGSVSCGGDSMEQAAALWFEDYAGSLEGWTVPYDYRISSWQIYSIQRLDDLETPYVQVDFTFSLASTGFQVPEDLTLIQEGSGSSYMGQMVLNLEKTEENVWTVTECMSPVEYQIQTPQFQEEAREPQTDHYKLNTAEPMTYYIEDETLYVTYDGGETLKVVPNAYEAVCQETNGTYDELLEDGSYVVSPEFTGFIGYNGNGTVLIYSTDEGETWQESRIASAGFKASSFLSRTENRCYACFAVDRSLGNDYYGMYVTEDFRTWTQVTLPETVWTNLDMMFWSGDSTGFLAKGTSFLKTTDGGVSWQELTVPVAEGVEEALGFYPFDTVERMYQEDGILYLEVGQGADGDYARDGKLVKALFQSGDGVNFTFVEEILDDTPELAG